MRAGATWVCLAVPLAACGSAPELDAGERLDLGRGDLGMDGGTLDLGLRDLGPHDAGRDGARDLGMDLGPDPGPFDAGPFCARFDAAIPDLGPFPDASPPFDSPDLGFLPDGALVPCPVAPAVPGYALGCPEYLYCLGTPGEDAGLTWDGFARDFFASYCTRCHSSSLIADDAGTRSGAPVGYDWDVRASVDAHLDRIRIVMGLANSMPFDRPCLVTCERRREIDTWIDVGAP